MYSSFITSVPESNINIKPPTHNWSKTIAYNKTPTTESPLRTDSSCNNRRNSMCSRRNSLRFSGIPEETDEQTEQVILEVANKLNIDIDDRDIERSHRVGLQTDAIRTLL